MKRVSEESCSKIQRAESEFMLRQEDISLSLEKGKEVVWGRDRTTGPLHVPRRTPTDPSRNMASWAVLG